jgi:hypothetical protein
VVSFEPNETRSKRAQEPKPWRKKAVEDKTKDKEKSNGTIINK